MIKRIRFATRQPGVPPAEFPAAWRRAVAAAAQAPPDARPVRIAVCLTLPELTGPGPRHDGVGLEWFSGTAHLRRFEDWLATPGGQRLAQQADRVADPAASPVIAAAESVLRGGGWLEQRWRGGGGKLKHMAIALRAEGLTPAEFARIWRSRAGQLRRPGDAALTVIPDEARGHAYVQNHPLPRADGGEWAYDAVNEAWFDDDRSLRTRIGWFRENLAGQTETDLVRQSWFLAASEEVLA